MRAIALALAILLPTAAWPDEPSKAQCERLASQMSRLAETVASEEENYLKFQHAELARLSSGDLQRAAQRTAEVRDELVRKLHEYRVATEDLAYQLRRCAR